MIGHSTSVHSGTAGVPESPPFLIPALEMPSSGRHEIWTEEAGAENERLVGETTITVVRDLFKKKKEEGVGGWGWGGV